jgi:hypothetical protein
LTREEKQNLDNGRRYILEAQQRAWNRKQERIKQSRLNVVPRRRANGR